MTRVTAMRLIEQEATDTGQSVAEVARAMLFDVESDTIEVTFAGRVGVRRAGGRRWAAGGPQVGADG